MHQDPDGPYREQSKAAKGGQKRPRSAGAAPYDSRLRLPRFTESRFTDHGSRSFPVVSALLPTPGLAARPVFRVAARPGPQLGRSQNLAKLCQPSLRRQPSGPLGGPRGNRTKPAKSGRRRVFGHERTAYAAPLASPGTWREMQVSRGLVECRRYSSQGACRGGGRCPPRILLAQAR